MASCKIVYDNQGNKIGVSQNNQLFQEILNNPQIKNFDEALSVFLETYSGEFELNANNINGFYSNAEQSLLNLKDKNPKNVKGWISQLTDTQKNGGIKNVNQELEWIGLEDYLNEYVKENNPKAGNIPSSVVEDYIKSNQIEIVDVSKGGILSSKFDQEKYDDIEWQLNNFFEDGEFEPNEYNRGLDLLNSWRDNPNNSTFQAVVGFWNKQADSMNGQREDLRITNENTSLVSDDTKYSGYQLKGAENYREVLLTMPSTADTKESKEHMDYIKFLEDKYNTDLDMMGGRDELSKDELEKLKQLAEANYDSKKDKIQNEYSSSHWDEKNILAHVRLNEKTLPDGRRVLIVNEIQADISQDLKKEQDKILGNLGYKDKRGVFYKNPSQEDIADKGLIPAVNNLGDFSKFIKALEKDGIIKSEDGDIIFKGTKMSLEEAIPLLKDRKLITKNIIATFGGNTSTTITPYKGTDMWVGVAFRRILKLAVDEGYSGVALATGQQSADMYSLSQQVDRIDIEPAGNEGLKAVYISMKNNADDTVFINQEGIITESASGAYNGKQAEEVLGKDLTRKILETTEETTLEGEGLEFGGEGMKTFYDKIVPKVVQKEAQRFDKNAKLETVDFSEQPLRVTTDEDGNRILVDYTGEVVDAQYGSRFTTDQEYIDAFKDAYNNSKGVTINKDDKLSLGVQPYLPLTQAIKSAVSEAVPMFSLATESPTLKYQTQDGQVFSDYGQALRNTQGEDLFGGLNTVSGFKPLFTISSNTNVNTQQGLINYLIKAGIASGKTYTFNGKTHIIPEGKTSAKKTINAEIIKDTFQQKLGVKTAKLQADGSILIDEDASRNKVRITNKKGEVVTADLNAPFSELKKEFEPETIAQIFAGNTLNKAMSGRAIVKQEFVPEDKLQEMLMNLLKKFGIKTLSFEDYLKNYQIRNGLPINARALADTANKLIAFKGGIIENDDLVEEVAHLIESSIPQEQKENILRNIHKTKEWGQFYEQYKNLYPTENELRREILGKVIANSIKEQFQARNQNITEDSIINKIKQFFDEFLARIRAYFQDSFQTELDNLTKEIYKNLEEDTLTLDLEGVNNIFFSDANSSVSVDKIVEKTQKAIEIVKDQERLLAKKYKNPANKSAIQSIEKSFEFAERVYKVNGVAQFAKLISSQVNTLLDSANKKEKGKYPLNAEENVVYVNLIKKIKPALSEIEFLLDTKDSQEMAIKEELEKIADSLRQLEAKVVEGREDAILDLAKKAVATHDMTDKERAEYENLVRMALSGSQKDTDIIHAHLGSLLMAKNPLLNLAGNTIERMTLLQNEDFQKNWKKLTSKLQTLDWKQKDFEAIIDEETFEIINERDAKKVEKVDAQEKEEIKNKVLESLKLVGEFEIEGEPNFEELQLKYPDRQDDLNLFESAYKRAWNKNLSERRESFFKKEFIKAKENHPVKINGEEPKITPSALEVEAQFRKERASIRINAGDNLSPSDQARIKEVDRQQRERENPRNSLTGELYKGIKEVYDEKLERWVVVLNKEEFRTLSTKDQEEVSTIVGLNHLRYKTQDFYKKRNKERDIPQTFLDRLAELQTTEEKLAFIDTNAFISFPDEYYNQFKDGQGLIDRLREAGEEGLIKSIRTQQAIINNIIKQVAVHNRPSETNYVEMHETQKNAIKIAQSSLNALYTEARGVLTDEVVDRELNMTTLTNEAYENWLIDSGVDEFQFILDNVTPGDATLIQTAKYNAMSGKVNKMFTRDMDDVERQQVLMEYAKSKLLPYLKRTEPVGYTEHYQRMMNGKISVEEWMQRTDLVKVSPSFSFYEQSEDLNPVWQENKKQGKEQWTQEYIDKVKDTRYDDILKNERLRQGREAILEYQDYMIENNNLTGVQSRYMIPGVRRTTTQRLTSLTASGIKETFMEGLQFRPEEQEVGARIQDSLYTVPVYYNKPLEDKAEQTKDYLYAYAVYGQTASQHKARRETISDMFVIEDALGSTNTQSKNTLKMFKSFMEYNYYGKKEAFSYEMNFLGRKVDVGKILRTLNNYAKQTNLAGLAVPITSFAQATVQKNMERIIGETIDGVSSNEGNAMFMKYAGSSARESMSFESKSIPNVIGEALGLYSIVHRLENSQLNKAGRLAVNLSSKLHELGNFPVVQRAMFGIIASYRYVDGKIMHYSKFKQKMISEGFKGNIQSEWKKQESFLEDFVLAVEDGFLDFNNPKFAEKIKTRNLSLPEGMSLEEYLESKKQDISTRTLAFINRIDSQIPKQQKSIGERDARATFLLSHMGWLLSAIPRKIKERHYNYSEQTFQEGSWTTAVNFLNDILKNPKKIREVYGELDENQQKNLKRTMVELGYANALVLVALLLSNMNDDDDDPMYALAMADLFANRVAVEQIGGTVGIPSSIFGLTEEPIMLKRKIEDWVKVTNLAGDSEEQFKYLKGVLPFLRDIEKFADPIRARQTYLYFNEERKGLYSKYAWISHAIEE